MNSILEDYKKNEKKFMNAKNQFVLLIESLLETSGIVVHTVSGRVKTENSLDGKLVRKNNKYKSIEEVTDIIGIRIITYTEQVINDIEQLLSKEFEVLEITDKRVLEVNKFGYKSLHLIMKLNEPRSNLLEFNEIKDLKFEVQIRTILQHAWAEIEHDIGYKGTDKLPQNITRSFARIASLLELADMEFVKILDEAKIHQNFVGDLNDRNSQKLNVINIQKIVLTNKDIKEIDKNINKLIGRDSNNWIEIDLNETLERLSQVGIDTNEDLINALEENQNKIIEFCGNLSNDFKNENNELMASIHGITLFYLIYVLLAKNFNEHEIEQHLIRYGFNTKELTGKLIKKFYGE